MSSIASRERALLDRVAGAVGDGLPVDWAQVEQRLSPRSASSTAIGLRYLAEIAQRRSLSGTEGERAAFGGWAVRALLALAAVQVLLAVAGFALGSRDPEAIRAPSSSERCWSSPAPPSCSSVPGPRLRAWPLAGVMRCTAAAMAQPLLARLDASFPGAPLTCGQALLPEAFLPALLLAFCSRLSAARPLRSLVTANREMVWFSLAAGVLFFGSTPGHGSGRDPAHLWSRGCAIHRLLLGCPLDAHADRDPRPPAAPAPGSGGGAAARQGLPRRPRARNRADLRAGSRRDAAAGLRPADRSSALVRRERHAALRAPPHGAALEQLRGGGTARARPPLRGGAGGPLRAGPGLARHARAHADRRSRHVGVPSGRSLTVVFSRTESRAWFAASICGLVLLLLRGPLLRGVEHRLLGSGVASDALARFARPHGRRPTPHRSWRSPAPKPRPCCAARGSRCCNARLAAGCCETAAGGSPPSPRRVRWCAWRRPLRGRWWSTASRAARSTGGSPRRSGPGSITPASA